MTIQQAARRKIGYHHLAFLRGQIQENNLHKWWDTYLYVDGPFREATAKQTVRWLKDELGIVARRSGRPRIEAILRRDASRIPEADTPALEEFAARFEAGFYSEKELQELWVAEYGAGGGAARKARLIQRQLEAVTWLETLAISPPRAEDPLDAWLAPNLAKNLMKAKFNTFGELADRMNGKLRWWAGIKGVGRIAAERVRRWMLENQASLQLPIGLHAGTALTKADQQDLQLARSKVTAVVPFENFLAPADLDGSNGQFRAPPHLNGLGVNNDYEAAQVFIESKRSPHTQRAYRKEIERLMLWAILVRGKEISSLSHADALAYQLFLRDPQPAADWCGRPGSRGNRRFGPLWRPFEGPLKEGAERHALVILANFYEFLRRKNYVVVNPFSDLTPKEAEQPKMKVGHALSEEQWSFVQFMLTQGEDNGATRRLVFAVNFLYATGLRLDEAVRARLGKIKFKQFSGGQSGWLIEVEGKGKRHREIPIPDGVMELLHRYLAARRLNPDPRLNDEDTFLIGRIDDAAERLRPHTAFAPEDGISAATLYTQLKVFFGFCADQMARENPLEANHLRQASTHWLRHSFATHAIANQVDVDIVQTVLGHASLATTAQYNDAEQKRVHQAMQAFWGKNAKSAA